MEPWQRWARHGNCILIRNLFLKPYKNSSTFFFCQSLIWWKSAHLFENCFVSWSLIADVWVIREMSNNLTDTIFKMIITGGSVSLKLDFILFFLINFKKQIFKGNLKQKTFQKNIPQQKFHQKKIKKKISTKNVLFKKFWKPPLKVKLSL